MKLGILGKVLLPILVVVVLTTGGGFYFSYGASRNAIEDVLVAELTALSRLVERHVASFIGTVERDLTNLSHLQRMQASLTTENETARQVAVDALNQFAANYPYLDTIVAVNMQGRVVSANNKKHVGVDLGDRPHVRTALSGTLTMSEPLRSRLSDVYVITMSVPVIVEGKVIGALLGSVPVQYLSDEIVKGIHVANSGYPFIVDAKGLIIAHPVAENIGKTRIQDFEWGRQAMAIENGIIRYTWQDTNKLATVLLNKRLGWRIIFTLDIADVAEKIAPAIHGSLIAMVLVLGLISLSMFMLLRFYVSRPLGLLASAANQVANGDLNLNLSTMDSLFANKGELTHTHHSIGRMLHALKENIALADSKTADAARQTELALHATEEAEKARLQAERAKSDGMHSAAEHLEGSIAIISSASEQLSAQIEQSGRGAEQQSVRVTETATAMEEMNSTVSEVARSASSASQMSAGTRGKAAEGAAIVQDVVKSIRAVRQQSLALKEDMNVLSGHAQSINQIMSVISDIADQTNLLALNAAIEAARAGDAGRGFAVVADEVRKLAEKTMLSTTDVGNAISSIQQSADKNMKQVDLTVQTIEEATTLADTSGQVLQEIVGMAENTADQVRSIATASEEQSATSEEINRSISQVNGIAAETTSAMHEASRAVADLASQAQTLQALVEKMKTE